MHRDVKPDNFAMGNGLNPYTVYIIDYGLAKPYQDPTTHKHIPLRDNKKLAGTARYASIFTHQGYEQSRRDDLECLWYSLIYLMKGKLPWQGMRAINQEDKYEKIHKLKKLLGIEYICKGLPEEIKEMMTYTRSLAFEQKPDYLKLRKLCVEMFYKQNSSKDFDFDWYKLAIDMEAIRAKHHNNAESIKAKLELSEGLKLIKNEHVFLSSANKLIPDDPNFSNINTASNQYNKIQEQSKRISQQIHKLNEENKKCDNDSCNFNIKDIIEDIEILGNIYIYYKGF